MLHPLPKRTVLPHYIRDHLVSSLTHGTNPTNTALSPARTSRRTSPRQHSLTRTGAKVRRKRPRLGSSSAYIHTSALTAVQASATPPCPPVEIRTSESQKGGLCQWVDERHGHTRHFNTMWDLVMGSWASLQGGWGERWLSWVCHGPRLVSSIEPRFAWEPGVEWMGGMSCGGLEMSDAVRPRQGCRRRSCSSFDFHVLIRMLSIDWAT